MRSVLTIIIIVLFSSTAFSHQSVVVVPLFSKKASLKNVVTVSQSGGDYQDIASALSSITDASTDNPYTILVGPGKYNVTAPIVMKDAVSLIGSGTNSTIIYGAVSVLNDMANSSIIIAASNSSISGVRILNTGGSGDSIGIYADSETNSNIYNVYLDISGVSNVFGIYENASQLAVFNIDIKNSGAGNANTAIYCKQSQSVFNDIRITATGSGNALSYGFDILDSNNVSMHDVSMTLSGGYDNFGINNSGSILTCSSCRIDSQGGSNGGDGFFQDLTGTSTVSNSNIKAASTAVFAYGGSVKISNSTISAVVLTDDNTSAAAITCLYVGGNDNLLGLDCSPTPP